MFFSFSEARRQHMDVFSFHFLKSENNIWMFFLSIYISLKKTLGCFFFLFT
jgi:hypothetical protein